MYVNLQQQVINALKEKRIEKLERTYSQFGIGHKLWMLQEILKKMVLQKLRSTRTTMTCNTHCDHKNLESHTSKRKGYSMNL